MLIKQGEGKILKVINDDEIFELSAKKVKKVLSQSKSVQPNQNKKVSEKK